MMREINTGIGYRSQNQIRAHFGLGSNINVDSVIVRWPSGWIDVLTDVPADNIITINEYETIPVELVLFSANVADNNVELHWQTATELNNSGFEIERASFNPKSTIRNPKFEKIGFIPGFGTTTEPHLYSFIDSDLESGIYSYRLKQIDLDGSYEYSEVIEVQVNQPYEFVLEQNYPNPFNPNTTIEFRIANFEFVKVKVYDVLGNEVATLVNEELPAGNYDVEFSVAQDSRPAITSGVYFYQLKSVNYIETKKMVLTK